MPVVVSGDFIMCLSSILSHEEDHACVIGDFHAAQEPPRFNEISVMLHENSLMFKNTDILTVETYSHKCLKIYRITLIPRTNFVTKQT